jgi:hypothetical protein
MSNIRDLIFVSASVLAFSAVADAGELRPIRTQGIDLPGAAAPVVEIDHGPRIRVLSPDGKTTASIAIWRTVTLGTYKTIDALRDALDAKRILVGDTADEILGRPAFNLSRMRRDAPLVVLSVSEFGFEEEGASLGEIYTRARQLGFELCPAEVAPQLRLQYLNQPLGEFLHIAMAPIARYGGELTDFHHSQWRRRAHSDRWLCASEVHHALDHALGLCRPGAAEAPGNQSSRVRFGGFGDRSCQSGEPDNLAVQSWRSRHYVRPSRRKSAAFW